MRSLLDEMVNPVLLAVPERRGINRSMNQLGLDGNGRFHSLSEAIRKANEAMRPYGISTDMISGDMLLGSTGNRRFTMVRTTNESSQIVNSFFVFTWMKMETGMYEVLAYVS